MREREDGRTDFPPFDRLELEATEEALRDDAEVRGEDLSEHDERMLVTAKQGVLGDPQGGVPDLEKRDIAIYWQKLLDATGGLANKSDILGIVHVLRHNEFIRGRCHPWPAVLDDARSVRTPAPHDRVGLDVHDMPSGNHLVVEHFAAPASDAPSDEVGRLRISLDGVSRDYARCQELFEALRRDTGVEAHTGEEIVAKVVNLIASRRSSGTSRQSYVMAMAILQSDLYRDGDDELRAAVDAAIASGSSSGTSASDAVTDESEPGTVESDIAWHDDAAKHYDAKADLWEREHRYSAPELNPFRNTANAHRRAALAIRAVGGSMPAGQRPSDGGGE